MAFDPWSYDADKDCFISMSEAMAAVHDWESLGIITEAQANQVVALWQNGTKNPACGIGDWQLVATKTFTIQPSTTGDWQLLATKTFTIQPSITGDWQLLVTKTFTVTPEGFIPTCSVDSDCSADKPYCVGGVCVECRNDADCPEGYVCKGGKCVKKEAAFPWGWILAIGAIIAAIALWPTKKPTEKPTEKKEKK